MPRTTPVHPLTLISARLDGEISPCESRFLNEHLETCADCRRKEAGLRAVATGLRELPVPEPPAGALDRLLVLLRDAEAQVAIPPVAASPQAVAAETSANEPRPRRAKWYSALAASAVVGIALAGWFLSAKPGSLSEPGHAALLPPVAAAPRAPEAPSKPAAAQVLPSVPELPTPSEERHAARTAPPSAPAPTSALPPPPSPSAPVPVPSDETRREPGRVWIDPPPLSFKGDAKRLTREARERVEDLAGLLLAHPELHVAIRGYTDERRSTEKTLSLGQKRGERIARHLQDLGVDESRLRVESLPIDRPAEGDLDGRKHTSEDRVEFILEPQANQPRGPASSEDLGETARGPGAE